MDFTYRFTILKETLSPKSVLLHEGVLEGFLRTEEGSHRLFEVKARSGGWGNGPAPEGVYKVEAARVVSGTGFKGTVTSWFASIVPKFTTSRTELGIHPDGGVPGTLGCIGVLENDSLVYAILRGCSGLLVVGRGK